MLKRLLPYDLVGEYKPGTKMAMADYGSRAPLSKETHREFRITNNDIGIKCIQLKERKPTETRV